MTDHANHLRRADWTVAPTEHRTAVRLVETWHYSKSAPNTSVARHGLYRRSDAALTGDPYGVAMWMPPTRAAGESIAGEHWRNVLNLSRLAVAPDLPTNAASYLLGASMRLIDRTRWPVLVTYADTALGHTGAIYLATNWTRQGETKARRRVDRTRWATPWPEARRAQPQRRRDAIPRIRASAGAPEDPICSRPPRASRRPHQVDRSDIRCGIPTADVARFRPSNEEPKPLFLEERGAL